MKVRFTPDAFRFQRAGGVTRYFVELAEGLRAGGVDATVIAGLHINAGVRGSPAARGIDVSSLRPDRLRQAATKAVDFGVDAVVMSGLESSDILHPTWYPPLLSIAPRRPKLVVTVFDMVPERFPGLVAQSARTSRRKRAWVDAADRVLAISECTKRDLVAIFGVDPDRVDVTPLAARWVAPAADAGTAELAAGSPWLLYVGDRSSPYKNFARLARAVAAPEVERSVRLVCFGAHPPSPSEREALTALGLADRVVFLAGGDARLAWLYEHAGALVYPSLYEGFGLPPLEAMIHGCAVIAADAASIPEVVGEAAVLVDPEDDGAWVTAISEVLGDPSRRGDLVDAGWRRAETFTWDRTVQATLDAYRVVAGEER